MNLHLVGGFLGSGKTTAIIGAARHLMTQGKRVGVVTNDQGKYLVDTAFLRLSDVPTVEVTGGCFCCNFDDLEAHLEQLKTTTQPDVIFAESVGSCADLVATVIKPLLKLSQQGYHPSSFSVFTDSRLLHARLLDLPLPFSDDVLYIFDQQISEAGLLVVNKSDLLSRQALEETQALAQQRFPQTPIWLQNSLDTQQVIAWLGQIESGQAPLPTRSLEIDYQRYGAGEGQLAWLDESLVLNLPKGDTRNQVIHWLEVLLELLRQRGAGVGHLKLLLKAGEREVKISFPTLEEPGWQARIPHLNDQRVEVLVNARIQMEAGELRQVFHQALTECGISYHVAASESFFPRFPNPTHRIQ